MNHSSRSTRRDLAVFAAALILVPTALLIDVGVEIGQSPDRARVAMSALLGVAIGVLVLVVVLPMSVETASPNWWAPGLIAVAALLGAFSDRLPTAFEVFISGLVIGYPVSTATALAVRYRNDSEFRRRIDDVVRSKSVSWPSARHGYAHPPPYFQP